MLLLRVRLVSDGHTSDSTVDRREVSTRRHLENVNRLEELERQLRTLQKTVDSMNSKFNQGLTILRWLGYIGGGSIIIVLGAYLTMVFHV